mmetsp:Transcript_9441/g.25327  ORF Transcript_9441/g.25327 Transcript_9441/m.25327 type:complete len:225 (-) Transcript_9441:203-877(-)
MFHDRMRRLGSTPVSGPAGERGSAVGPLDEAACVGLESLISRCCARLHSSSTARTFPRTLFTWTMRSPGCTGMCGRVWFQSATAPPVTLSISSESSSTSTPKRCPGFFVSTTAYSPRGRLDDSSGSCAGSNRRKSVRTKGAAGAGSSMVCPPSAAAPRRSVTTWACGCPFAFRPIVNCRAQPAEALSGTFDLWIYTSRPKVTFKAGHAMNPYPSLGEKLFRHPW